MLRVPGKWEERRRRRFGGRQRRGGRDREHLWAAGRCLRGRGTRGRRREQRSLRRCLQQTSWSYLLFWQILILLTGKGWFQFSVSSPLEETATNQNLVQDSDRGETLPGWSGLSHCESCGGTVDHCEAGVALWHRVMGKFYFRRSHSLLYISIETSPSPKYRSLQWGLHWSIAPIFRRQKLNLSCGCGNNYHFAVQITLLTGFLTTWSSSSMSLVFKCSRLGSQSSPSSSFPLLPSHGRSSSTVPSSPLPSLPPFNGDHCHHQTARKDLWLDCPTPRHAGRQFLPHSLSFAFSTDTHRDHLDDRCSDKSFTIIIFHFPSHLCFGRLQYDYNCHIKLYTTNVIGFNAFLYVIWKFLLSTHPTSINPFRCCFSLL